MYIFIGKMNTVFPCNIRKLGYDRTDTLKIYLVLESRLPKQAAMENIVTGWRAPVRRSQTGTEH
jgi:hypothetical protein